MGLSQIFFSELILDAYSFVSDVDFPPFLKGFEPTV